MNVGKKAKQVKRDKNELKKKKFSSSSSGKFQKERERENSSRNMLSMLFVKDIFTSLESK